MKINTKYNAGEFVWVGKGIYEIISVKAEASKMASKPYIRYNVQPKNYHGASNVMEEMITRRAKKSEALEAGWKDK